MPRETAGFLAAAHALSITLGPRLLADYGYDLLKLQVECAKIANQRQEAAKCTAPKAAFE